MHVDVIKNEWLAGFEVVVARLSHSDRGLQVTARDEHWKQLVERVRAESDAENDEAFLMSVHQKVHGDYVYATELHDEDSCPFHEELVRPLAARDAAAGVAAF